MRTVSISRSKAMSYDENQRSNDVILAQQQHQEQHHQRRHQQHHQQRHSTTLAPQNGFGYRSVASASDSWMPDSRTRWKRTIDDSLLDPSPTSTMRMRARDGETSGNEFVDSRSSTCARRTSLREIAQTLRELADCCSLQSGESDENDDENGGEKAPQSKRILSAVKDVAFKLLHTANGLSSDSRIWAAKSVAAIDLERFSSNTSSIGQLLNDSQRLLSSPSSAKAETATSSSRPLSFTPLDESTRIRAVNEAKAIAQQELIQKIIQANRSKNRFFAKSTERIGSTLSFIDLESEGASSRTTQSITATDEHQVSNNDGVPHQNLICSRISTKSTSETNRAILQVVETNKAEEQASIDDRKRSQRNTKAVKHDRTRSSSSLSAASSSAECSTAAGSSSATEWRQSSSPSPSPSSSPSSSLRSFSRLSPDWTQERYQEIVTNLEEQVRKPNRSKKSRMKVIYLDCPMCDEKIKMTKGNGRSYNSHVSNAHGLLPYRCRVVNCGLRFATCKALDEHQRIGHTNGTLYYECEMCVNRKKFIKPDALRVHLWRFHETGLFRCIADVGRCKFESTTRQAMDRHWYVFHNDGRSRVGNDFACSHCSLTFSKKANLLNHTMRYHPPPISSQDNEPK